MPFELPTTKFQHVTIPARGILNATYLLDFGRINVICGKNNSGKTTLLTAIASKDGPYTGQNLSDALFNDFAHRFTEGLTQFRNGLAWSGIGREVVGAATVAFKSEPRWFKSDFAKFLERFADAWKRSPQIRRYTLDDARAKSAYDQPFPDFPSRVLVPPKRNLDLQTAILNQTSITPQGAGLLNHLFHWKNQEIGSKDRDLYNEVAEQFTRISDGYLFDVVTVDEGKQISLRFRTPQGHSATAYESGLGLQDLIIILYFAISPDHQCVLIEEPESHLHPDFQRKLLQFFERETKKQFVLSTHSNIFLDGAYVDAVYFTTYSGKITVRDETNRALLLSDLGYQVTDNLISDLIVLVEGPKDVPVLELFLNKIGKLQNSVVKFWPLGGDIMDQLDLSVFADHYKIIALIDQDPGSSAIRQRFVAKCGEAGIKVHRLNRYALENYLSLRAIREVFKGQVSESIQSIDQNKSVEVQLGFSVKKRLRHIARAMSAEEIQGTDLHTFLVSLEQYLVSGK